MPVWGRVPRSTLFSALFALTLVGCDRQTGIVASTCTYNSDCQEPLVCSLGRCHRMCAAARDCPDNAECVQLEGGGICKLPADDAGLAVDAAVADGDASSTAVADGDASSIDGSDQGDIEPPTARLAIDPATYEFADTVVGARSGGNDVFSVVNVGRLTVGTTQALEVLLSGSDKTDFILLSTCPTILVADANCTIAVVFAPSTPGRRVGGCVRNGITWRCR